MRKRLSEKEAADPKYEKTYEEYKPIMELIINKTGINVTNKTKAQIFSQAWKLLDTLFVYVSRIYSIKN